MNNLKNLVAKANSGLSLRSETKQKFGLGSFIAASTEEMLVTRGGDSDDFRFLMPSDAGTNTESIVNNLWNATPDGTNATYLIGAQPGDNKPSNTGNTDASFSLTRSVINIIKPSNVISFFSRIGGMFFSSQEAGRGSAKTDNPNYKHIYKHHINFHSQK